MAALKISSTRSGLSVLILQAIQEGETKSPHELFYGNQSRYAHNLQVFGQAGIVWTGSKNSLKAKFKSKCIKKYFVGYAKDHSSDVYRMYSTETGRVSVTRNIRWSDILVGDDFGLPSRQSVTISGEIDIDIIDSADKDDDDDDATMDTDANTDDDNNATRSDDDDNDDGDSRDESDDDSNSGASDDNDEHSAGDRHGHTIIDKQTLRLTLTHLPKKMCLACRLRLVWHDTCYTSTYARLEEFYVRTTYVQSTNHILDIHKDIVRMEWWCIDQLTHFHHLLASQ